MKFEKTNFDGLLIIQPDVYEDNRGLFFESFNEKKYNEAGIADKFVQDNVSKSCQDTIRGLHLQVGEKAQGKLCQVISGSVLDVAVDVRRSSPTFGKYFSIELSDENHLQLWIPKGFAHGFLVLTETAIFSYKCTTFYDKASEQTILFNDPDLNINWGIKNPIVSDKDLNGETFQNFCVKYI
jgi:dTDP-4-dehydrorhamnose 3,5-epimerase